MCSQEVLEQVQSVAEVLLYYTVKGLHLARGHLDCQTSRIPDSSFYTALVAAGVCAPFTRCHRVCCFALRRKQKRSNGPGEPCCQEARRRTRPQEGNLSETRKDATCNVWSGRGDQHETAFSASQFAMTRMHSRSLTSGRVVPEPGSGAKPYGTSQLWLSFCSHAAGPPCWDQCTRPILHQAWGI